MIIEGKDKIITGLIGVVLILAGFGGNALLTDDEYKNAYVCSVTEELGIFAGGLSGTEYRGYPTEGTTKGYKDCKADDETKGIWVKLETYAKSKGVDPLIFLVKSKEIQPIPAQERLGTQYICSPDKCVKIR